MNTIEIQWQQLKAHETAGRMFDNEHDLVMNVIEAMEFCRQAGNYVLERFRFNCLQLLTEQSQGFLRIAAILIKLHSHILFKLFILCSAAI